MAAPNYQMPEQGSESGDSVNFRAIYYTLVEHAWVILLCLVAAGFVTAAYLKRAPKIYQAKVILKIGEKEANILNIQNLYQNPDLNSAEGIKTIEQTLQSRSLFERLIDTNKLATDPRFVGLVTDPPPSKERLISKLAGMVKVQVQTGTRLINITVEHTDPKFTEELANSIVTEYMRQNFEAAERANKMANQFLVDESTRLQEKLTKAENSLTEYQKNAGSLEGRRQNVAAKLRELNEKATAAKGDRINAETEYNQVLKFGTNVDALLSVPSVARDPKVGEVITSMTRQKLDIAALKQRYLEKHPKLIQASNNLAELQRVLASTTMQAAQAVKQPFQNAQAREEALNAELKLQEKEVEEINKLTVPYNILLREIDADRAAYDTVIRRIKESSMTKDMENSKIQIYQTAYVPERPIKPNREQIIFIGVIAGLVLGVGLAMGLAAFDSSLKTLEEAESFLRVPVLSTIPQISRRKSANKNLVMLDDSQCSGAESFRSLRTQLSMLGRGGGRSFLFTSALPEEGKTFCSINYAISLAQQGLSTLLVEGDLRRPAVEQYLSGTRKQGPGIADYLEGEKPFNKIVRSTEIEHLSYVSAGTPTPNPAELLAQHSFGDLVEEALRHFDRVVVDSAPIFGVSDSLLMVNKVQIVCLVVRATKTPRKASLRVIQMLQKASAPFGGVVLNGVPRRGDFEDPYYDYGYYPKYAGQTTARKKSRAEKVAAAR
jgi:capsular exopolysaccharide synthesis family protein